MFFGKDKDITDLEKSTEQGFLNLDLHALMYADLIEDLCAESGLKSDSSTIRVVLLVLFWNAYIFELGRLKDKKSREKLNLFALLQFTTRFKKEFDNYKDYEFEVLLEECTEMMDLVTKYVEPGKGTTMDSYAKATRDFLIRWPENKAFKSTPVFHGLIEHFLLKSFSPIMATILNFNIKYN